MSPLRVYIGYDPREEIAFHVLSRSIQIRSTEPVAITQVALPQLRSAMWREKDPKQSNAFSFSRFLVPYLAGYHGPALWMDCDMLCLGNIAELFELFDGRYAVQVVQQEHKSEEQVKYLGEPQYTYERKNWSSLMLFNAGHPACRELTPDKINNESGLYLHQFNWCNDDKIGKLPITWNTLIGVNKPDYWGDIGGRPQILHYTLGGPWFEECRSIDPVATEAWDKERQNMMEVQRWKDKMSGLG